MKELVYMLLVAATVSGCATTKHADRCLTYTISGSDVSWAPTKFYQSESQLIIQIPSDINFIPDLEIVDKEFNQPYKISYTFDQKTHRYRIKDNYDEYILYRRTPDDMSADKVYISCNR